ncbi:MAG: hypothetical protein Q8T11_14300 [Elusimicrobiota bacterium]|nr:hypothetical protein [Elusimicrobiota bacterium]
MRRQALLLSIVLAAPLAAQEPKTWYRTTREFTEAGVVGRKGFPFEPPVDAKGKFLFCAILPAADWLLDSREEHVEEEYLKLLGAALRLDRRLAEDKVVSTGVIGFCGKLRSPTPSVDLDRLDASWRDACQHLKPAARPGRYASTEGAPLPPKAAVVETLNALARSPREKTAIKALNLMEEIQGRDKFFAKTVSEVLRDPKSPLAVRERAAEVLASVHTHDLSAHTLAAVWGERSNPESLRRAALRGYSLIMSFGDPRTAGSDPAAKGRVRDRLHRYLHPLAGVVQSETKDLENGGDELTPLGEDAKCVAVQYSQRWVCYANRFGAKWYEEVKRDEAAGVDACAKDGKLKR